MDGTEERASVPALSLCRRGGAAGVLEMAARGEGRNPTTQPLPRWRRCCRMRRLAVIDTCAAPRGRYPRRG